MENNDRKTEILQIAEDVRKQVNIIDVCRHYLPLVKKGRNYTCLCPFHDDKSLGSFYVSEEKQIFHCYSCNAGGDVIRFVQKKEGITYTQAIKKVCEITGIKDDRLLNDHSKEANPQLTAALDCLSTAMDFYKTSLLKTNEGKEALDYLHNRGISDEIIDQFDIGYAPTDGILLINYLKKRGFSVKTIEDCGLAYMSDNPMKDRNAGRVIFSIKNKLNQIVAFSARIFNTQSDSKYINTRETICFIKSNILYNYAKAIGEAKKNGYIYVLEGFMDVIAAYRVGIKEAVGLMGTAFTKNHLQMLRFLNVEIRLCLDLDNPGQEAMNEIADVLEKEKIPYRMVNNITTCTGKDSDEILKNNGADCLRSFLNNLITHGEWALNFYSKTLNLATLDGRKKLVYSMIPILEKCVDPLEYEDYLVKLSSITKFNIENINKLVKKNNDIQPSEEPNIIEESVTYFKPKKYLNLTKLQRAEMQIALSILDNKEAYDLFKEKKVYFTSKTYQRIIALIDVYLETTKKDNYSCEDLSGFLSASEEDGSIQNTEQLNSTLLDLEAVSNQQKFKYDEKIFKELIETVINEREDLSRKQTIADLERSGDSEALAKMGVAMFSKKKETLKNKNK